jgi:hypothetical protein
VRVRRDDHSRRRHLAMNSNLWLKLARLVWDVQSSSEEIFRTKVREEYKGLTMLLSVHLGIDRGGRSGGVYRRATFGAPRLWRLRQENEK